VCLSSEHSINTESVVQYNEFAIANIISMSKTKEHYPVEYDSTSGTKIVVVHPTKEVIFEQSSSGLYYHDTKNCVIMVTTNEGGIKTVKENREGYAQQKYEGMKQVQCTLGMVGYPSPKEFGNMVPQRTKLMVVKSLENMFTILYTSRGFKDSIDLMDGEFECLHDGITGVQLNSTPPHRLSMYRIST
jgi:hypothetical protein